MSFKIGKLNFSINSVQQYGLIILFPDFLLFSLSLLEEHCNFIKNSHVVLIQGPKWHFFCVKVKLSNLDSLNLITLNMLIFFI